MTTLDAHDDCDCKKAKPIPQGRLAEVEIQCLACEHKWRVAVPLAHAPNPLEHDDYKCHECRARMVRGKLLYREVIEPYVDEKGVKWARRRFQDPKTKQDLFVVDTDRETALSSAKELLSLVTL